MTIKNAQQGGGSNTSMGQAFADARDRQGGEPNNAGNAAPQGGRISFSGLSGLMNSPVSKKPGSELLSKYEKKLAERAVEVAKDFDHEYTFIPLDMNNTTKLRASGIIVCVRMKKQPEMGVGYHTLIIEATSDKPNPVYENLGGRSIEILKLTGDAFNQNMIAEVEQLVSARFPQSKIFSADAEVIYNDFDLNNDRHVNAVLINAILAAHTTLQISNPDYQDLNLADIDKSEILVTRPTFGNSQIEDSQGHPVRADIQLRFESDPNGGNVPREGQQADRVTELSTVTGYADLVWAMNQAPNNQFVQNQNNGYGNQQQAPRYLYGARFVMTSLEAKPLLTLPMQLLVLASTVTMRDTSLLPEAFRSNTMNISSKDVDLHDFGYVTCDPDFQGGNGEPVDTQVNSFDERQFAMLYSAVVNPEFGISFCLDVPECGESTWFNMLLLMASEGNKDANDNIIAAANFLTNGLFSQFFGDNDLVAVDDNNRIHNGYYFDKNNVRHDLREIDMLAALKFAAQAGDMTIAQRFSDTYSGDNVMSLNERLSERKKIITGWYSNAVFTGFSRRVVFTARFIDALARAVKATNTEIRTINPYIDRSSFNRAATASLSLTAMGNGNTGLFRQGYNNGNSNNLGGNRSWGGSRGW